MLAGAVGRRRSTKLTNLALDGHRLGEFGFGLRLLGAAARRELGAGFFLASASPWSEGSGPEPGLPGPALTIGLTLSPLANPGMLSSTRSSSSGPHAAHSTSRAAAFSDSCLSDSESCWLTPSSLVCSGGRSCGQSATRLFGLEVENMCRACALSHAMKTVLNVLVYSLFQIYQEISGRTWKQKLQYFHSALIWFEVVCGVVACRGLRRLCNVLL